MTLFSTLPASGPTASLAFFAGGGSSSEDSPPEFPNRLSLSSLSTKGSITESPSEGGAMLEDILAVPDSALLVIPVVSCHV